MAFVPLNTKNSTLTNYNMVNNAIRDLENKKIKNDNFSTTPGQPGGQWKDWTPIWTNLTVGNGTVVAKYTQIGKLVSFYITFVLGTTSSISGAVSFTLPISTSANMIASTTQTPNIGSCKLIDAGVSVYNGATAIVVNDVTKANIVALNASGTYLTTTALSATIPFTWGSGDGIYLSGTYEAA